LADYFRKVKSLYSSTANSFGTGESETITPASVTGLPTDTEMVLTFDRTVSGKLERIKGTISGGNFVISSGGRGEDSTTEQAHTSPTVEYIPNAADMNDMVTGILIEHGQTGVHDATKVAMIAGAQTFTGAKTFGSGLLKATKPKITTSIDDANGNELLISSPAASAVNEVTVANAAANGTPQFSASGEDTNIDLHLTGKGTGGVTTKGKKRVTTITSNANPTINTDNCDVVDITAQAADIASMTTNLSGTPSNFQTLIIRFKDDGNARGITWGTSFEARGTALPTTTVISKILTVGFIYDTTTSKWGCVASQQEA